MSVEKTEGLSFRQGLRFSGGAFYNGAGNELVTHCSAFSQAFFSLGAQWTQKVINDPPFAGLDFGGDIHARPKAHFPPVDNEGVV